jgi:cation:H+ antiporter
LPAALRLEPEIISWAGNKSSGGGMAQVCIASKINSRKLFQVQHELVHLIESKGDYTPWLFLALFVAASFLMIWRLEAMSSNGFEGTVLGTLVMPYCSGLGNLVFAFILGRNGGNGADVMTNSLVNNVTNMTLVLGLPAILWGIRVLPKKTPPRKTAKLNVSLKKKMNTAGKTHELNRLSLLLTLAAVMFFTGAVWALGQKGRLDLDDGLVLIGLFLFWQCFHVIDVLKHNVRQGKSGFGWMLPVDLGLLAVGAYGIYISTDWLVNWISHIHTGFVSVKHLGWLSGWLMVLPNALLAFYYSWRGQPETVYASQVGDAHVSIPLCIGIYALYHTLVIGPDFQVGMLILLGATLVHFLCVAVLGQLPRAVGWVLVAAYGVFLYKGLLN